MQSALESVPGVESATVTLDDSLAVVRYKGKVAIDDMIKAVVKAGYNAKVKSGPVSIEAVSGPSNGKKQAAQEQSRPRAKSLVELHRELTQSPYKGIDQRLQIELTLVTGDYLKALYEADRKAGKVKESFSSYAKNYRVAKAIAFKVKMETHSVDTSPFDMQKAAVLIDNSGKKYAAIGWQELPSPMPNMAYHHRRGILFFPKLAKLKSAKWEPNELKSFEVVLQGLGGIAERRFKWVFPGKGGK